MDNDVLEKIQALYEARLTADLAIGNLSPAMVTAYAAVRQALAIQAVVDLLAEARDDYHKRK